MRFEVPILPPQGAEIQGSKRGEREYHVALERFTAEVCTSAPRNVEPFKRAHLSIVAFVGKRRGRYFRPESPYRLWPALDGVFDGLKRANILLAPADAPIVTTAVVPDSYREGVQITIEELAGEQTEEAAT